MKTENMQEMTTDIEAYTVTELLSWIDQNKLKDSHKSTICCFHYAVLLYIFRLFARVLEILAVCVRSDIL